MRRKHKLENVAIRMVAAPPLYSKEKLDGPRDVVRVLGKELEDYDREVLCVVNLRNDLAPINMNVVSMGSINSTYITAREVFKSSILSNAGCIMLVHNHTSGSLFPSRGDIAVTEHIRKAAELMDIPLVDHIILGKQGEYFSFLSNGLLTFRAEERACAEEKKESICGLIREYGRREERTPSDRPDKGIRPVGREEGR